QPQPTPQRENQVPRPYQPPAEGHHSGQWLNQHREQPLDQQKRALQSDPQFKRLPTDRQQKFEQRLQRFDSMPADRQQQVLRRMEIGRASCREGVWIWVESVVYDESSEL